MRRISITPLASIVRTNELGSGTLARRNPMLATSFDGSKRWRYEEAMRPSDGVIHAAGAKAGKMPALP